MRNGMSKSPGTNAGELNPSPTIIAHLCPPIPDLELALGAFHQGLSPRLWKNSSCSTPGSSSSSLCSSPGSSRSPCRALPVFFSRVYGV